MLTYGALVSTALKEHASVDEVNKYLEQTYGRPRLRNASDFFCNFFFFPLCSGYNIGVRLIDEFLARSGVVRRR